MDIYHGDGMQVPSDADLLAQIESFLVAKSMAPSRFGLGAIGDGALVFQLRDGKRSLTLKSAQKIARFMAEHTDDAGVTA